MVRAFVVGFAVVIAAARGARAENGFVWDAPATCPDGDDVRARIERRLGGPLEIHGVEVAVTRDGRGFVAHVDTRGVTVANQIRTLTSARCDELADAVAVVVARLASEWRRVEAQPAALVVHDAGIEVDDAPVPTHAVVRDLPSPPASPATRGWGGGVHALALSGVGTVPNVGWGAELAVFVRRKSAFAEVGYARWSPNPSYVHPGAPGRVEVGLAAMTVRAGWSPAHMPLRAWVGGEVGSMFGAGAALEDTRAGSAPYIAMTAGFGVGWPMSQNARLVGTFEVAVPTRTVHFALAEGGDIYTSSAGAARCAVGLELGWP